MKCINKELCLNGISRSMSSRLVQSPEDLRTVRD